MAASNPNPNPLEMPQEQSLAESIAIATRGPHARLNKLIIARLPLVLPPHAPNPTVYATGILHIAPLYIAFERAWLSVLSQGSCDKGVKKRPVSGVSRRLHTLLDNLHLPGLMRTSRLRADLGAMTGWSDETLDQQLHAVQNGRLGEFISHIERSVENRPHVVVAYAYILYMALFAGGRYIRATLETAGQPFWDSCPSPVKPTAQPCIKPQIESSTNDKKLESDLEKGSVNHVGHSVMPLRFFHFSTAEDGEDLKREFKRRLAESSNDLTPQEKKDIVKESVCLFDNMTLLVGQLDSICVDMETAGSDNDAGSPTQSLSSLLKDPLGVRYRDSLTVTKERVLKRSSRQSSSSSNGNTGHAHTHLTAVMPAGHVPFTDRAHPVISDASASLCPGMPKSMRFEKELALPHRSQHDGVIEHAGPRQDLLSRRSLGTHITDWIVVAACGIMVLGALFTGRLPVLERV